jgi:hypothetical protein
VLPSRLFATFATVSVLLAGCGGGDSSGGTANPQPTEPQSSATEARVAAGVKRDLQRQASADERVIAVRCSEQDGQCSARVRNRKGDFAIGVGVRFGETPGEYAIITTWSEGRIRSAP